MLERFRSWLEDPATAASEDPLDTARAVSILLVAAARADGDFEVEEAHEIARLVSAQFALPPHETAELVAAAAAEETDDLFPVARLLVERLDGDGRRRVLALMWRVVLSDGRLESREDILVRKVARLFDLPHRDLIDAKLTVKRELEGD
jgi:uncharacterized tellurite resistance protein B-like protein